MELKIGYRFMHKHWGNIQIIELHGGFSSVRMSVCKVSDQTNMPIEGSIYCYSDGLTESEKNQDWNLFAEWYNETFGVKQSDLHELTLADVKTLKSTLSFSIFKIIVLRDLMILDFKAFVNRIRKTFSKNQDERAV